MSLCVSVSSYLCISVIYVYIHFPSHSEPPAKYLLISFCTPAAYVQRAQVWSLLEMATYGVVTSFDKDYSGACGNH